MVTAGTVASGWSDSGEGVGLEVEGEPMTVGKRFNKRSACAFSSVLYCQVRGGCDC